MRILDRWEDFVHTHFETDGQRLSQRQVNELMEAAGRILRERSIVFGVHFDRRQWDRGIRLVLECRPRRRDLDEIHQRFAELLEPVPVRPPVSTLVHVDAPESPSDDEDLPEDRNADREKSQGP